MGYDIADYKVIVCIQTTSSMSSVFSSSVSGLKCKRREEIMALQYVLCFLDI